MPRDTYPRVVNANCPAGIVADSVDLAVAALPAADQETAHMPCADPAAAILDRVNGGRQVAVLDPMKCHETFLDGCVDDGDEFLGERIDQVYFLGRDYADAVEEVCRPLAKLLHARLLGT